MNLMKKWFNHKSIFIKLLIIGWMSIFLIVLPSFFVMSYFLHKTDRADRFHIMIESIIIQMLNARIAEKNFMLRDLHDEKFYKSGFSNNLQKHQLFIKTAKERIGFLIALRPDNANNDADRLLQLVNEYNNTFSELVDTYQKLGFKDWGLLGQWREAIHEVERQITRMNRTDIYESLLQLRRREKDYLLREDEKYLEDIRNQISDLRREILKIPNRQALKISEKLTAYENAFYQFTLLQKKIGRTDEEGLQRKFNDVVEKMRIIFDNIMTESKSEYERARFDLRLRSLIIYILGIAVGSMVYYLFARSISLKLITLKNGVLQVGKGHLDTMLPIISRDEIGIVTESFNKMTAELQQITVSKNYVDKIIESMADMLIVISPEGLIERVNLAVLDLLGYAGEELIGKRFDRILAVPTTESSFIDEIIRAKAVHNFETEIIRKDSQKISIILSGSSISDNRGIVCIAKDYTERKRAEEMLRKSERELRLLSSKILEAQETERQRVARELHDGIGQALTGIKFSLENRVRRIKETETPPYFKELENIISLIQSTVDETRRIAMGLRPSTLDDMGISETIYWFCQQFEDIYKGIRIQQSIEVEESQIPEALKTVIFRVLQESLNNVAKHSKADCVQIGLLQKGKTVKLVIEDNGIGFDPQGYARQRARKQGFGVASMKERTELSGGIFTLQSSPGQATSICAVWPTARQ